LEEIYNICISITSDLNRSKLQKYKQATGGQKNNGCKLYSVQALSMADELIGLCETDRQVGGNWQAVSQSIL
jgi:hypothetical protein